jgi:UTP--glucose-1-phosphate uridylyltransferase
MVTHAIIPAAGLGTRVLPASKAIPKEMFPIPHRFGDRYMLYPMIHLIFDTLYKVGIRNFCFVISPSKEEIKEYFKPDQEFIDNLIDLGKEDEAKALREFYDRVTHCKIGFRVQEEPLGVGDAVLRGKEFVGNNNFMINMGDDLILGDEGNVYREMIDIFISKEVDGVVLVKEVEDPRHYGVVIGKEVKESLYKVEEIIEKPKTPVSNLAILGIYVLKPWIFHVMEEMRGSGGWELTDAVDEMAKRGEMLAYKVENIRRIDIGRVETYIDLFKDIKL